jgi:arsenite methyltransferase
MSQYLGLSVDPNNPDLISAIDELPLWSAPFGLRLLEVITLNHNMKVLDIGCGTGFPLVELAQRLGTTSHIYGVDPWEKALERIALKLKTFNLANATVQSGVAEALPFSDGFFDLIVSNNGLNNVRDVGKSFAECGRVCKQGGEFVISFNLDETMKEFYSVLKETLIAENLPDSVLKMEEHIYEKRRPLEEIIQLLKENHFSVEQIIEDTFYLRYTDGTAMLNHSFISHWFLDSWEKLIPDESVHTIFRQVEQKLNEAARKNNETRLTIPFVVIKSKKQ